MRLVSYLGAATITIALLDFGVASLVGVISPISNTDISDFVQSLSVPYEPAAGGGFFHDCKFLGTPVYGYELCASDRPNSARGCGNKRFEIVARGPINVLSVFQTLSSDRMMKNGFVVATFNELGEICSFGDSY